MNTRPAGHSQILIFGIGSSRDYAARLAARMGLNAAPVEESEFGDGEHRLRPGAEVRHRRVAVVHSLFGDEQQSVNDKLCRLLFFCAQLKDAGAGHLTAVLPYLCYARADRRVQANDPVINRYVAGLIEACRIDEVLTVDVHNLAAFENAFRCPARNLESAPLLAEHFAPLIGAGPAVVVSPDTGGIKRAERLRRELSRACGREIGSAYVEKFRDGGKASGRLLAGEVRDRQVLIVDDMISTGETLARAAHACAAAGASRVLAAAAHGLFSGGAPVLFQEQVIEQIVVLDTVPPFRLSPESVTARLTVLDSTGILAAGLQ